jgi:hypothetical protein
MKSPRRGHVRKAGKNKNRPEGTCRRTRQVTLTEARDAEELQRSIVGSLIDLYHFKIGGLVKKANSVFISGMAYRLVSYYTVDDITRQRLSTPCDIYLLQTVESPPQLDLQHSKLGSGLYNDA